MASIPMKQDDVCMLSSLSLTHPRIPAKELGHRELPGSREVCPHPFQSSFMVGRERKQAAGALGLPKHRHRSVSVVDILEACRNLDLKGLSNSLGSCQETKIHPRSYHSSI